MVFCVDFEGGLACGPGMRWMSEGQKKKTRGSPRDRIDATFVVDF